MGRCNGVRRSLVGCCLVAVLACASGGALAQEAAQAAPAGQPDEAVRAASEASNAFAIDLYKKVAKPDDNLFFSPASVSLAVGFAYRGAVGQTASELRRLMRFPDAPADYLRAARALNDTIKLSGPGRELRSANAFWVRQDMPLRPDYQADMAAYAAAGLHRVDFSHPRGPGTI